MADLRNSKAPNLLIGPVEYTKQYQDQLNNALRLYFNQIDNFSQGVLDVNGGHYLSFPHIAAQDSTDQYATADDTPTKVLWDTLDSASGFTLNSDSTATPSDTGLYKIDYSLQLVNDDNVAHEVHVWLKLDNVDVPGSASKFSIPARKSVSVHSYVVAYSSIAFKIVGAQKVSLWWVADKAANPVGPVTGVYMEAYPAQTTPYPLPSLPSAIGTITFVSRIST